MGLVFLFLLQALGNHIQSAKKYKKNIRQILWNWRIRRIKNYCIENNNNVDFKFDDYDFFVEMTSITKTREKITQKTTQKIIASIKENSEITRKELSEAIGLTEDGIKYHLKNMQKQGIIKRIGPDKGGYWKVLKK